jgi:hypothetical protein
VETETDSKCCVCKNRFSLYKGKHVCSNKECKVGWGKLQPVWTAPGCNATLDTGI